MTQPRKLRSGSVTLPRGKIGRLQVPELERRCHPFQHHRHEAIAFPRIGRFVDHPFRGNRITGPDDDDARRVVQRLFYDLVKTFAVGNVTVPPDFHALGFQRMHQRSDPLPVRARIAEKDFVRRQGMVPRR